MVFCGCCVSCDFGRLVVGRACPCPLFVCWFASVCGLVARFCFCLVLSCGCPPLLLAFGGADQWFRGIPLVCLRLDIWLLRQRSGRLAGLYYLLSVTDWSGDGVCPFSFVIVLYGNKGFGPVWGTALHHAVPWRLWFLAFPLGRLHVAP